jgi:hypothetical protein
MKDIVVLTVNYLYAFLSCPCCLELSQITHHSGRKQRWRALWLYGRRSISHSAKDEVFNLIDGLIKGFHLPDLKRIFVINEKEDTVEALSRD